MMQRSERAERATPHRKAPIVKTPPPLRPEPASAPIGRLSAARAAALQFLSAELGAREVRITKLIPAGHGAEGWSAEAEILVPNLEVKMLGLPLTQEILEREHYAIELDADLSVRSYAHARPDDQ
jgi:hypothetical protein